MLRWTNGYGVRLVMCLAVGLTMLGCSQSNDASGAQKVSAAENTGSADAEHGGEATALARLSAEDRAAAGKPVAVPTGYADQPHQPQAAVDEIGTIHVAFGAGEWIHVSSSADLGRSFGHPVEVGRVTGLALGRRRGPRIVAAGGVVVASASGHKEGNVLAWRSIDGGATWSGPVIVNDSPGHASEGLHAMAVGPEGQIYAAWLDHRNGATQLFGAGSEDGGQTWSENRLVYASPDGNVCECCHPSLAYDADGNLYAMWRNSLGGYRDMYLTVSRDGGATFSAAEKLGHGGWKLAACPMDGGSLAVSPAGEVTTVWRRDSQIFRTDSGTPKERLLGSGMQPWAATTPSGAHFVWLSRRGGDLWLAGPDEDEPQLLAKGASDPVIAAPLSGEGPVVAVWEAGEGDASRIWARVVN